MGRGIGAAGVFVFAIWSAAGVGRADTVVEITDSTAYAASAGNLTTIDFQSVLGPNGVGADYNNQTLSIDGVNFNGYTTDVSSSTTFSTLSVVNYSGYSDFGPNNPTAVVGGAIANTSTTEYDGLLTAGLPGNVTAIGLYVGLSNPLQAGTFTLDVITAAGDHDFTVSSQPDVSTFVGFTSNDAITEVDISGSHSSLPSGQYSEANIAVGDFSFNSPNVAAVPLPAPAEAGTMLLAITGLIGLRQRRTAEKPNHL